MDRVEEIRERREREKREQRREKPYIWVSEGLYGAKPAPFIPPETDADALLSALDAAKAENEMLEITDARLTSEVTLLSNEVARQRYTIGRLVSMIKLWFDEPWVQMEPEYAEQITDELTSLGLTWADRIQDDETVFTEPLKGAGDD